MMMSSGINHRAKAADSPVLSDSAPVTVLVMAPNLGADLSFLAIDPRVRTLDGNAVFSEELRTEDAVGMPIPVAAPGEQSRRLLAEADVLVIGHPVPQSLMGSAPRLRWVHHTQAGVSNLLGTDVWSSGVSLTSSRGAVAARGIAEYAVAAAMFAARGLDEGARQKAVGCFIRDGYRMRKILGSTFGVIGLGGIGREVGRIAQALGARVLATRQSIVEPEQNVDGADIVLPADATHDVAAQSDVLVICSQLTEVTRGMIGASVFDAMPSHAILVNVARGEEIDEAALLAAVREERIAGAVLDVYDGELERREPRAALLREPRILLTPHISGLGDAETMVAGRRLIAENLRRFLAREPLLNLIDRHRGY